MHLQIIVWYIQNDVISHCILNSILRFCTIFHFEGVNCFHPCENCKLHHKYSRLLVLEYIRQLRTQFGIDCNSRIIFLILKRGYLTSKLCTPIYSRQRLNAIHPRIIQYYMVSRDQVLILGLHFCCPRATSGEIDLHWRQHPHRMCTDPSDPLCH